MRPELAPPLRWRDLYREAELYKAAVRVYTKPLFQWRKALAVSTDGRTLYDFASSGLRGLDALHRSLRGESFRFRPAVALHYNFNGKPRTLYVSPWEERIVDLLLYRLLTRRLQAWFSPRSFAYRERGYGLDACQSGIARWLRSASGPIYLVKRDIADYFGSVRHDLLLAQLGDLIAPGDFLWRLLLERVHFAYRDGDAECVAVRGIPFGAPIACLFANVHLTAMDRDLERRPVSYFRYADDILVLSASRDAAVRAAETLDRHVACLGLEMKPSHRADLLLAATGAADPLFAPVADFRHLGLRFHAGGDVSLSRDKSRKIRNLFRFAFRRARRRWRKLAGEERARCLSAIAAGVIEQGVRNVAIVDYYLKHVDDERQLRLLDRWLAEEVLALVFGGHRRSHFRRIGFEQLRAMGLPSLVYRRRLIRAGRIASPFFIWRQNKAATAFKGAVARPARDPRTAFSRLPEAAAGECP